MTTFVGRLTAGRGSRPALRRRYGRPSRGRGPELRAIERGESGLWETVRGSHMPLDTNIHWHWRNPLNILPFGILFLAALALLAAALG